MKIRRMGFCILFPVFCILPFEFPGKYVTIRLTYANLKPTDAEQVLFVASVCRALCEIRKDINEREK